MYDAQASPVVGVHSVSRRARVSTFRPSASYQCSSQLPFCGGIPEVVDVIERRSWNRSVLSAP